MEEEWKFLPGHEGVIEVSNEARVRSVTRVLRDGRTWRGRLLTARVGRSGYLEISVPSEKPWRARIQLHRAVCLTFNGEAPSGKPMVLHRDGDRFNNRPENLYWGDYDDNMQDRIRHGRHFNSKTQCKRGHELSEDNVYRIKGSTSRYCRKCRKIRHRKWYENVKEARNG